MKELGLGGDPLEWGIPTKWLSLDGLEAVQARPVNWRYAWLPLYYCGVKSTSIIDHQQCSCKPYCDNIS